MSERNGEIDVLRFVFSIVVLLLHFQLEYGYGFFFNGYIGVEFFFLVSGYLMAWHVQKGKLESRNLESAANETWSYLIRKISAFYRYYLSAVVFQLIIRYSIIQHVGIGQLVQRILRGIPYLTLTFMGFGRDTTDLYVGNTWYLSCMVIAILILYPVLLRLPDFSTKIFFPLLAIFVLAWLMKTNRTITLWKQWSGLFYYGVLRALANMALGASLTIPAALLNQKYKKLKYKRQRKVLFFSATILKFFCYAVVLGYAYGSIFGKKYLMDIRDLHVLLFCALGVLLSFSQVGVSIRDKSITRYMGRISLPIFIYHGFIRYTLRDLIGRQHSRFVQCIVILLTIMLSVVLMYVTDWIIETAKKCLRSD